MSLGSIGAISPAYLAGIDVSAWQPHIDWAAVAEHNAFAFVKATEGPAYVSPTFRAQREGARKAGLLVGSYHFARWLEDATKQAEHFARVVGGIERGELSPVLDLEWNAGLKPPAPARLVDWTLTWLRRVEALTGRRPILYTGPSFWRSYLLPAGVLAMELTAFALWTASYTGTPEPVPMRGAPTWTWDWWQWTGSGRVAGVTDAKGALVDCDRNWFRGSVEELRLFAGIDSPPSGGST